MARGDDAIQKLKFDQATEGIFERVIRVQPDNAKAWGSLALSKAFRAQVADREHSAEIVDQAADAVRRALALNPKEPNALLTMVELEGSTVDWFTRDRKLRQIIGLDPTNVPAVTELVALLQAAGLNRESWDWNERALAIQPLSPDLLGRRALKLWIAGRASSADKVIDQARDLYPADPWVAWVRFLILALTGRARGAEAILAGAPPTIGPPASIALWRACLPALDRPSPGDVAKARQACARAATIAGGLAAQGVMILCALAEVDQAFDIANGFLLWRGSLVRRGESGIKGVGPDALWRISTQWLFTPPCAVMRADARFLPLCDGIGLTEYWKRRGVKPDYQLAEHSTSARL
jgi:tetratricopeptide (TPR) repeat protein